MPVPDQRPEGLLPSLIDKIRRHPLLAFVLAVFVIGGGPAVLFAQTRQAQHDEITRGVQRVDPRYATQSGSLKETRKGHVQAARNEQVDSSTETCAGVGTAHLAAKYGLPADEVRVARRFAAEFERVYRKHAFEGCLKGLREGG